MCLLFSSSSSLWLSLCLFLRFQSCSPFKRKTAWKLKHKWVLQYLTPAIFLSYLSWMKRQKCKKTWLEREEVMRKCLLEGGVDVSFEGWKCFKQKGRLNKGWRKNKRQRVGTLKETMNIMYAQFPTVLEHPLSEGTPPFWVPPPSFWSITLLFESHPNWCMQIVWNTLKWRSYISY